ncbi:hypothetical protein [Parapedobacter tibetensis]|uniref:hypothetical protein n=1 Tax=Parapedobacter tibetensis TaxID=2972951 RepID=UPI00214DBD81|nr:hypothetical protein [Parapedobacter tibetensis]
MKNNSILIIALAIVATQFLHVAAKAQVTGTTTLKVKLTDALSLTVNNEEVLLDFATAANYADGVEVDMANHLTVTSTKAYTINVKAASTTLAGTTDGNTNTIASNAVNVEVSDPSAQGLGGTTATVALSANDAALLTGATAASGKNINVKYGIPAANTGQVLGKTADTYTTILTYTITQ